MNFSLKHELGNLQLQCMPIISKFLINDMPVNIFVVDLNGYIAWGNSRMLKTLHLKSLDEFVGKHVSDWGESRWLLCLDVIKNECEYTEEESKDQNFYLTTRKPIFDDEKNVIGVVGISLDITDRKKAEIAKQDFLYNMAHDIRTPFAGICGFAQSIYTESNEPNIKKQADYLVKSADMLLAVLNQVIEVSKIGTYPVKNEYVNIQDILHEVIGLLQPAIELKNIELIINSQPYIIYSDKFRVHRILLNLISNAVKFNLENNGILRVEVLSNKEILTINVENSAKTLLPEASDYLFNNFIKLKPSYEQGTFTGLGTGLYIARYMANEIKSEISAKNNRIRNTIIFSLRLRNVNSG